MSERRAGSERERTEHSDADNAPGDESTTDGFDVASGIRGYVVGLLAAAALTVASFWAIQTDVIYVPGVPVFLVALAIGQMGVHLVFFLHITTGPDNTNNVLALAFGVLIVGLVLVGSVWIMSHLNHNMMPMDMMKQMQR